jgi:CheY-like chemotaxis protein
VAATPKRDVLIVDDDADIRESLGELLQLEGYTVHEASNGADALNVLATQPLPCVVLLDLMMPVMSGSEFIRQLAAHPARGMTLHRVIVMSANVENVRGVDLRQVAAVITKPFETDKLVRLLDEVCARPEGSGA